MALETLFPSLYGPSAVLGANCRQPFPHQIGEGLAVITPIGGRAGGALFLWVDILPKDAHTQVACLPKSQENGWNCYRAPWPC